MKLLYPAIPLTVTSFDDTRAYISADAPDGFDRALADFFAGRVAQGKSGFTLPRRSRRASVMEAVGGAAIRISYGRRGGEGQRLVKLTIAPPWVGAAPSANFSPAM
jgi:hypothetical protein